MTSVPAPSVRPCLACSYLLPPPEPPTHIFPTSHCSRVLRDAAPGLLQAGGAHLHLEPAQEHDQAVLGRRRGLPQLQAPQERAARAPHRRGRIRGGDAPQGARQLGHHLRPRLRVRLLRLQGPYHGGVVGLGLGLRQRGLTSFHHRHEPNKHRRWRSRTCSR